MVTKMLNLNSEVEWIKSVKKSLKKFLKNCPISFSAIYVNDRVRFQMLNSPEFIDVEYDFNLDPKDFIHNCKLEFLKFYPRVELESVVEKKYDDIEEMLKDLELYKGPVKKVFKKLCVVDKVILQENVVMLWDIKANQFLKYKSKLPIVLFKSKLECGGFKDTKDLSTYFEKNFELVTVINPK